jgi:hypothetical protein
VKIQVVLINPIAKTPMGISLEKQLYRHQKAL